MVIVVFCVLKLCEYLIYLKNLSFNMVRVFDIKFFVTFGF